MNKSSRVFNKPISDWDHNYHTEVWPKLQRDLLAAMRRIAAVSLEWQTGGTHFLNATAARRSQNFFLTNHQKLIQSPTHERKF